MASKAVLRWDVLHSPSLPDDVKARFRTQQANRITTEGELVLSSQRFRDQERNRQDCLDKLAEMVREAVYPQARLVFDASKPDGTPRKLLDVTKMTALGWRPKISLADGIRATYRWFLHNAAVARG